MKRTIIVITSLALSPLSFAEEKPPLNLAEGLGKHQTGSRKLANEQDELSADVQDLIEEQTDEKVIQLLEEVEEIMAEVTEELDAFETGGTTIAAETDIIEKIFEAAKQKQSGGT